MERAKVQEKLSMPRFLGEAWQSYRRFRLNRRAVDIIRMAGGPDEIFEEAGIMVRIITGPGGFRFQQFLDNQVIDISGEGDEWSGNIVGYTATAEYYCDDGQSTSQLTYSSFSRQPDSLPFADVLEAMDEIRMIVDTGQRVVRPE